MGFLGIVMGEPSSAWPGVRVETRGCLGPLDPDTPAPPRMARRERFGSDFIDVGAVRRLAPDDLSGSLNRRRVVDSFAAMADSERGCSAWMTVPRTIRGA